MSSLYEKMLNSPHHMVGHPFEADPDEIQECAADQADELRRDLAKYAQEWSAAIEGRVASGRRHAISTVEPDLRQLRVRIEELLIDEFHEVLTDLDRLAEEIF